MVFIAHDPFASTPSNANTQLPISTGRPESNVLAEIWSTVHL